MKKSEMRRVVIAFGIAVAILPVAAITTLYGPNGTQILGMFLVLGTIIGLVGYVMPYDESLPG